jgi:hypothetical protein
MRLILFLFLLGIGGLKATTLSVVPVFEPISLEGTDVDAALNASGEALRATVLSRPMVLSGAFPECLVEAIRTPHVMPSNDPGYDVREANLMLLCKLGIGAKVEDTGLTVTLDVTNLAIPEEVDLTAKQVLRLVILAVRKTLELYQEPQVGSLKVDVVIVGTTPENEVLKDLESSFLLEGS